MDITTLSATIVIVSLAFYVLLDGFDLGVGALMLAATDRGLRDRLAESIEPTWDGNETWLIMAGVSLLAAFPVAYSILLPAFYLPLFAMLICLGFRAVAFDFRRQEGPLQGFWDRAFSLGSLGAAFAQGLVLGGLLQGVSVQNQTFAGSLSETFRPLPILTGMGVTCGYAVLGATWARWRLPVTDRAFLLTHLHRGLLAAVTLGVIVLPMAAHLQPALIARWTEYPITTVILFGGLLITLCYVWRAASCERDATPFLWCLGAAALALAGLVFALAPNIVPFKLSFAEAAAPPSAQRFYAIGAAIVIPVVLSYTAFAYWTFRGKIAAETSERLDS